MTLPFEGVLLKKVFLKFNKSQKIIIPREVVYISVLLKEFPNSVMPF
jgi:hypothetical protein